jgi:uncharacterized protein (PEP-CTERM system associated)
MENTMDIRASISSSAVRSRPSRERCARRLRLAAAGLMGLAAYGAHAAWQFDPRVVSEATYTDNINLDASPLETGDTVLHLAPGFRLEGGTPRFHATANYELSAYFYDKSSTGDQTVNTLDAAASGELVPDTLFIDLMGRAGRTVVNPEQAIATGDYYTGANFTDVALWRATPRLVHEFGGDVKARLAYDYGTIYYLENFAGGIALPNLTTRDTHLDVDRDGAPGAFGWHLKYNRQEAEYQGLETAVYSTGEASLEVPVGRRLWLLAVGGSESDVSKSITSGSLDAPYWEAGFRYQPSLNQQLRVTAGRRFYGNSYTLDYSLTGRRLKTGLGYSEAPAAQGIELYVNQIFTGEAQQPLPGLTPQDHEIYLRKSANGWATLTGARNELTLQILDDRRDYLASAGSEHVLRGTLGWRYRLGPRTELHAGAGWIRLRYRGEERLDDLKNIGIGVTRRLGRLLQVSAEYRYWRRDINGAAILLPPAVGFRENAFTLGLRYGR